MEFVVNRNKREGARQLSAARKEIKVVDVAVETAVANSYIDDARAMPMYLIRNAAFGVVGDGPREYVEGLEISTLENFFKISYSGLRLDMYDLDVYQAITELWIHNGQGNKIAISAYKLLTLIKRDTSAKSYESLKKSLQRLMSASLLISGTSVEYYGHMLESIIIEKSSNNLVFRFNEELKKIYPKERLLHQDISIRCQLDGDVAKWIYNFYSSHNPKNIQNHSIAQLCELCGTKSDVYNFKKRLDATLTKLATLGIVDKHEFAKVNGEWRVMVWLKKTDISKRNVDALVAESKTYKAYTQSTSKKVSLLPGGKPLT
ncbi:MAG TPA: replication initiator protein A [Anaerovoracaceae bacterium]|nr:replication initiator protein A [Anaerovoracaceae bacterium]